jgi:hypothetical protein
VVTGRETDGEIPQQSAVAVRAGRCPTRRDDLADIQVSRLTAASRSSGEPRCAIILAVDVSKIQAAFDDVFDQAVVFHGFADDYA